MVVGNLAAQQVPFNAIFLVSDPMQKWRLLANFVLYFLPFLAGALYLGIVFLKAQQDLQPRLFRRPRGLGPVRACPCCSRMYFFTPDDLIMAPLLLWLAGGVLWFVGARRPARHRRHRGRRGAVGRRALRRAAGCSASPSSRCRTTRASSYARKFPDAQRIYERASPFGYLEVYSSSYLHFAPGLSDNAAFNLPNMPANAYLGLYIDRRGPVGHHQGPAGRARRPISATCRCTTRTS